LDDMGYGSDEDSGEVNPAPSPLNSEPYALNHKPQSLLFTQKTLNPQASFPRYISVILKP